jgi:hypothetical protein
MKNLKIIPATHNAFQFSCRKCETQNERAK